MLKSLVQTLLRGAGNAAGAQDERLQLCIVRAAEHAAAGEHAAAVDDYRQTLQLQPDNPRLWCNYGAELSETGRGVEAEDAYRHALELDPALAQAWYNLGQLQQERGDEDEAERCYRAALALPDAATDAELRQLAHSNLGLLLQRQGRLQEAVQLYRDALAVDPADASLRSNLLFLLTAMAEADAGLVLQEHRDWGRLHAQAHAAHANSPEPERRLRIGYVSADFYAHPLAFHLWPLLEQRDRARTEVLCYSNGAIQDRMTERLRACADGWRDIRRIGDADADARIRADAIDILVDLSGHTAGNRLALFARKPAPLQATFLGYANTTGLDSMDYRITDAYADPPGAESRYVETLLRMPHSLWCYEPQCAPAPDLPAPLQENGYATFASFNGAYKLNERLLRTWAAILHAAPGSRLLLVSVPRGAARQRVGAWLAAAGIGSERYEMHARLATADFWAAHRRADIALDPFPCNGGATTCETLWLGVPVLTLAGATFVGRAGVSLLSNCGLQQLIARSPEEYVALAAGLAQDPARLAQVRGSLRRTLPASPLLDAPAYTQALEAHYRAIWRLWCSRQGQARA